MATVNLETVIKASLKVQAAREAFESAQVARAQADRVLHEAQLEAARALLELESLINPQVSPFSGIKEGAEAVLRGRIIVGSDHDGHGRFEPVEQQSSLRMHRELTPLREDLPDS